MFDHLEPWPQLEATTCWTAIGSRTGLVLIDFLERENLCRRLILMRSDKHLALFETTKWRKCPRLYLNGKSPRLHFLFFLMFQVRSHVEGTCHPSRPTRFAFWQRHVNANSLPIHPWCVFEHPPRPGWGCDQDAMVYSCLSMHTIRIYNSYTYIIYRYIRYIHIHIACTLYT